MNDAEVKSVVAETLDQLLHGKMIKYNDLVVYERMSEKLRAHYKCADPLIDCALEQLRSHTYYGVLEMYYRDNMTLEEIAEHYYCDVSTIVRNKKYLCIKVFELAV